MTTQAQATSEMETTPSAPQDKQRPQMTPEQRERKNARDRERRAAAATTKAQSQAAKQQTQDTNASHSAATQTDFEGTIAAQQAQRDRPFQRALGASLQAHDKARAARIRLSQQSQPDRK